MKTKALDVYNGAVSACVDNEYSTTKDAFRQPCLQMIVGQRTAGKSYLTSKILAQAKKDKTFDVVYIITPSFNSNKAYFEKCMKPEKSLIPHASPSRKSYAESRRTAMRGKNTSRTRRITTSFNDI